MEIERLGPYRIVGRLGRGGMGIVYRGVDRDSGQPAAIKLLSASLAQQEGFRSRFEAEIETLRKLNHPNIVRLFGFGEQDGHLFYAMELVEGNSLEEELRRGRRFQWREVARIGVEMCRALRHAHDRGIIHRDIKPGNVLLTGDDHAKLSDFGIARLFGNTRLTGDGSVLGTAEYMAPEQAEGRPVDARADLYSLGALMYALMARRPVFSGKSLVEVLHKQRFEPPTPLRKHAADVPEEFEAILAQLLAKDPSQRIPNASLLGRRLEAMLKAISVSPETIEADTAWFDDELPPSAAASSRPSEDLPTLLPEGGELPATQMLPQGSDKPSTEPVAATPTSNDAARARFTPVAEDELDQAETVEPKSAWPSWQTWAMVAALVAVGLSIRWFLQPPTADVMYRRIVAKTDNLSADAMDEKMSGLSDVEDVLRLIQDFSNYYSHDPRASRLFEYEKALDLRRSELIFEQQIRQREQENKLLPIEQAYLEAVNRDTRLNPTRAIAKLQAILDLYDHHANGETTVATPSHRRAAQLQQEAIRRCLTLARCQLVRLQKETEQQTPDQLAMLRERLDAADAQRAADPKRAAAVYCAVIELYADRPWAAQAVGRARQSLAALNHKPKP
ncbi:MAG: serine/threonine-protein kinase [Thermoguttaceae bacterium]